MKNTRYSRRDVSVADVNLHYNKCVISCWCSECPEMTLDANSPSRCPAVCNEELVLTKRDVVTLQCNYENPSSSTPTVYTWYVNDLPDPTLTGSTVDVSFPNSHSYNVRCTANNTESADCSCIASRNITVSVVGKNWVVVLEFSCCRPIHTCTESSSSHANL